MDTASNSSHHTYPKKVPFWERAFVAGNFIGVNSYRVNQAALAQLISGNGYHIHETPHFMICTQTHSPTILVHRFAPAEIDADLGHCFMQELKPLGLLAQPQDFGDIFAVVIGSLSPADPQRAWHLFGTNTLQRYHHLLAMESEPSQSDSPIAVFSATSVLPGQTPGGSSPQGDSPIYVFSTLYRRVCELVVGTSLLDAGCSFGFLPLVVAERLPSLTNVVGVDIRPDPFPVTRAIAAERRLANIQFTPADLLAGDFTSIGRFATVTALHVLEHFSEEAMYRVLANLLKVTGQRLIIAVPYEPGEPEAVYGHEQLFTRSKLEELGHWCLDQLEDGRATCEDCAGGLLLIDKAH
jgi:SAM-dependent methyltransferase